MTYRLVQSGGTVGIQCQRCGLISWHPVDVQELYCPRCHVFHRPTGSAGED
jgi:ribosomal protein L37E